MGNFWKISLSSLLTMLFYLFFSSVLTAFFEELENNYLALSILCALITIAFGMVLLFVTKIKKSIGDREIMMDYKERKYDSFLSDLKIVFRRESKILFMIVIIVTLCFLLNTFDDLVFKQKTISIVTVFYFPLCIFDLLIPIRFVGYFLSAAADCFTYIVLVMIYRKRRYAYWMKKGIRS